jgi:hypothetical protein
MKTSVETMEFKEDLESKSAPKIKKAATKIAKGKLSGYEEFLLSALIVLMQKPKSWQAQSEVIKAIGITGSEASLPYLKELANQEYGVIVLYRDLGFSICLLEDISNGSLVYAVSVLDTSNDLLLSGICAAILFSGFIPSEKEILQIIDSVADRNHNEGNVITPRCTLLLLATLGLQI